MARRIEIQLTSKVDEDRWSWRAAGAREPRGVLAAALVPSGAGQGDVFRAEIETSLDGLEVVSVAPAGSPETKPAKATTIELLGSGRQQAGVSWSLAPKSKRGGGRRDGRDGSSSRDGGPRREGRDGKDGDRRDRRGGDAPGRSGPRSGRPGVGRPQGRGGRPGAPAQSTEHRNALLATLEPAQLPIAEQLLRGGIPAVRQALQEQDAQAKAEGRPPASTDAIMAIAEDLLPLTTLAAWKDRASTAMAAGKETRLRDLRAIVAASRSVTLDDEGRTMAKALRESLDHRVKALGEDWASKITKAIDEGRLPDALRLSGHPPEPSTRLPAELATTLADAAGEAMTAETDPREWMALLDAVLESPVKRNVKPAGIPPETDVEAAARNAAGLVPALAKLLGLRIPPPPPRRVVRQRDNVTRPDAG